MEQNCKPNGTRTADIRHQPSVCLTAGFPAELLQSVLPQFAGMKLPQCFAGGRFNRQGADRTL